MMVRRLLDSPNFFSWMQLQISSCSYNSRHWPQYTKPVATWKVSKNSTHLQKVVDGPGNLLIKQAHVLGESVHYSSERVQVEEAHRRRHDTVEHLIVELLGRSQADGVEAERAQTNRGDARQHQAQVDVVVARAVGKGRHSEGAGVGRVGLELAALVGEVDGLGRRPVADPVVGGGDEHLAGDQDGEEEQRAEYAAACAEVGEVGLPGQRADRHLLRVLGLVQVELLKLRNGSEGQV